MSLIVLIIRYPPLYKVRLAFYTLVCASSKSLPLSTEMGSIFIDVSKLNSKYLVRVKTLLNNKLAPLSTVISIPKI